MIGTETQNVHDFRADIVRLILWLEKTDRGVVYLMKNYTYNDNPRINGPELFIACGPARKPKLPEAMRKDDV